MGFWKNIQTMLNLTPEQYINLIPSINSTITLFMVHNIDITEYNMEQFNKLYILLKHEDYAIDCMLKEYTAEELKMNSDGKKLLPLFYYLVYIADETQGETK